MSRITLLTREVVEMYARENFSRIKDFLNQEPLNKGRFKFFTYTFPAAGMEAEIPHRLGFQPKDILQTSLTGTGTLTWNYDKFTVEFLNITTTGPCVVRAFIGTYTEEA